MADEAKKEGDGPSPKEEGKAKKSRLGWLRSKKMKNIGGMLLAATLVAASISILLRPRASNEILGREVSLGNFSYLPRTGIPSSIDRAEFSLHISLLAKTDKMGRFLLASHQYMVQQNVEELLRQVKGGDFEDPSLNELKRQLQATINETLGERVIEEVIITDLVIAHRAEEPEAIESQEEPGPSEPNPSQVGHWEEAPPTP